MIKNKGITFGEMQKWTQRFNNVIEVDGELKTQRLENLKRDLEMCYTTFGPKKDKYAAALYCTVCDELWV